jgi:hypothetical protein
VCGEKEKDIGEDCVEGRERGSAGRAACCLNAFTVMLSLLISGVVKWPRASFIPTLA